MRQLIVLAVFLIATPASSDERFVQIESAWNAGDSLGVQNNFDRDHPRDMAEIGLMAEKGGKLTVLRSVRVNPLVFAVAVDIDGQQETWVFVECQERPEQFCHFDHHQNNLIGQAEKGQALDIATTATAASVSYATEANPLGLAVIPVKLGIIYGTHHMAFDQCVTWRAGLDMFGYGPGVANMLSLGGLSMGVSIAAVLLTAVVRKESATESAVNECLQFAAWQSG